MRNILEEIILEEINNINIVVEAVIITYAFCLKLADEGVDTNWDEIHQSIILRWDKSTLEMIRIKANTLFTYWRASGNFPKHY